VVGNTLHSQIQSGVQLAQYSPLPLLRIVDLQRGGTRGWGSRQRTSTGRQASNENKAAGISR